VADGRGVNSLTLYCEARDSFGSDLVVCMVDMWYLW